MKCHTEVKESLLDECKLVYTTTWVCCLRKKMEALFQHALIVWNIWNTADINRATAEMRIFTYRKTKYEIKQFGR
jgi:hypothetical protein